MNPKTNYSRSGTDPLWVHLEWITTLYVLFNENSLDWLMMVEGLPLGLLMQCYHKLSIFLSGGWAGYHFALCLTVINSFSPSLLRFGLFSLFQSAAFGPVMAAAHLWAVRALCRK